MTDVVTRLVVRSDGSFAVLDQFEQKMSDAGQAADMATGGVARFEAAQKKLHAATQAGLAISTESVARRTKEQRVFEQAASAIDKSYALRIRLEREAERSAVAFSNAVAAGYLRQEQALDLLIRQEQQHLALLRQGGGGASAGGNFNTANIAAQFQDIGVTAAMGMNPLQIALQQGTQISAVLSTMEKPLQGIAAGLRSIISPVSLLTIGLVALVAAGLQFVDWGGVAQVTLNTLADGIEIIAPYAAAAAVGLALLYSPAIIAGIGMVIGSIGSMTGAIVGLGTAIYAIVGLPALLIAGLVAIVTAAVIWRDDLTKMLGVDIVGAAEKGINYIIGAFVGGFTGVKDTWAVLPMAMSDITMQAAQGVLDGVVQMINSVRGEIVKFLQWAGPAISVLPGGGSFNFLAQGLLGSGDLTAPKLPNAYAGAADYVAGTFGDALSQATEVNYLGKGIEFVQNAASGAADALRSMADSIGVDTKASKAAAKEAERQAKAYDDLTRASRQFIADKELEASLLGMSAEAANRLRYEQDMLNKAANDNIKLSSEQRAEIAGLAADMAAAEEATRRLTEIYDLGKSTFSSFFADMKSGLKEGQSFWEALGNAGANALDRIADRALSMAADGIWDMIFGAVMGGLTGGFGTIGVGGVGIPSGGFIPGLTGPRLFDTGGYTGDLPTSAAAGIVHGREYVLNAAATQRIGVSTLNAWNAGSMPANQNGGDIYISNQINVPPGTSADVAPAIAREVTKELRKQLPDAIERHNRNPLRRAG